MNDPTIHDEQNRAKTLVIWAAAAVPVLLALLSAGCARDNDELEPRVVTPLTPEPMIDRGDGLDDTEATPSEYRENLIDREPAMLPPANPDNEPIRQRNVDPTPAPVPVSPGADATLRQQDRTSGTFVEPATPPTRTGGYWQNGVWVQQPASTASPYPRGTIGTVPPGQTQQPGTPPSDRPAPDRSNAPNNNSPAGNNAAPAPQGPGGTVGTDAAPASGR